MFYQKKLLTSRFTERVAPCCCAENPMSERTGDSLFSPKFPGSEFLTQRFGGEDLHELSTANINWSLFIAANPICNGMTHSTRKVRTTIYRLFRKRRVTYKLKITQAQEKNLRSMKKKKNGAAKSKISRLAAACFSLEAGYVP